MTDYSKLTDRELDALVAERVMGWTLMQYAWMTGQRTAPTIYLKEDKSLYLPETEGEFLSSLGQAILDALTKRREGT